METPEAAPSAAVEDAAATGGFEDDGAVEDAPVLTSTQALLGGDPAPVEAHEEEDDDEIEVPQSAENPDAVRNLIKAERKAAREANARAREAEERLKELEATPASATPATPAETQPSDAEARALRLEIALDKGLPKTIAMRLQGANREEMEADADALLAEFGSRRSGGGMDGGFRQDPPAPKVKPEVAHNEFLTGLLSGVRSR